MTEKNGSLTPLAQRSGHPHGGSTDAVVAYAETVIGKPVIVTVADGIHRDLYQPVRIPGVIVAVGRVLSGGNTIQYALYLRTLQPYRGGRSTSRPTERLFIPIGRVLDIRQR